MHLPAAKRGCHLVTRYVVDAGGAQLRAFRAGTAHIFIRHTSAALTVNESADPDVRADMETFLNLVVPEGKNAPWIHTDEGYDDMPAHCKASLLGSSVTLPVTNGKLALGTWQGELCALNFTTFFRGPLRCFFSTGKRSLTFFLKNTRTGIYLAEFRDHGTPRELTVTVQGESTEE